MRVLTQTWTEAVYTPSIDPRGRLRSGGGRRSRRGGSVGRFASPAIPEPQEELSLARAGLQAGEAGRRWGALATLRRPARVAAATRPPPHRQAVRKPHLRGFRSTWYRSAHPVRFSMSEESCPQPFVFSWSPTSSRLVAVKTRPPRSPAPTDDDPLGTPPRTEADADGDGVLSSEDCDDTDPDSTIVAEDADCDGVPTAADCDDGDPGSTTVAEDADRDGLPTAEDCMTATRRDRGRRGWGRDGVVGDEDCDDGTTSTVVAEDADQDGVATAEDCDDGDPTVYPGAEEVMGDGLDNNCNDIIDGAIDESVTTYSLPPTNRVYGCLRVCDSTGDIDGDGKRLRHADRGGRHCHASDRRYRTGVLAPTCPPPARSSWCRCSWTTTPTTGGGGGQPAPLETSTATASTRCFSMETTAG